ncbi:MAG: hypothetical protein ACRC1L_13090 [Prochlorococcaceae cyanobacterium]
MKLHPGNFGATNRQPCSSTILGVFSLFIAGSGIGLLLGRSSGRKPAAPPS